MGQNINENHNKNRLKNRIILELFAKDKKKRYPTLLKQ